MKGILASITLALLGSAHARGLDSQLVERAGCKKDLCLRPLLAKGTTASQDCAAYLAPTVICPSGGTSTVTVSTQPTATSTSTVTVPYQRPTLTWFIVTTFTFSTSTTVTVTPPVSVVTRTTVLAFPPTDAPAQVKRDDLAVVDQMDLAARTVAPACSTVVPTSLPKYAAPCTGTRYASACSCIGAPKTTITVGSGLNSTTTTVTATLSPSVVRTNVTVTAGQVTVTTTISTTTTEIQSYTVTTGTTATTTTIVPTGCTTFIAQAFGGPQNGQYVHDDSVFYPKEYAQKFRINVDHTLTFIGGSVGGAMFNSFSTRSQYYDQGSVVTWWHGDDTNPAYPLYCNVVLTPISPSQSLAFLTCIDGNGATQWKICDGEDNLHLRWQIQSCPAYNLLLTPACD